MRRCGRTAVSAEPGRSGPRDGRDHAARIHLANVVIGGVGNKQISQSVAHDAFDQAERGARGLTTITARTGSTVSGECRNHSARCHSANLVIARVGNVDVTGGIERNVRRSIQSGRVGRCSVAGRTSEPSACQGADVLSNAANAIVFTVRDIDRCDLCHGVDRESDPLGVGEQCVLYRAAVTDTRLSGNGVDNEVGRLGKCRDGKSQQQEYEQRCLHRIAPHLDDAEAAVWTQVPAGQRHSIARLRALIES